MAGVVYCRERTWWGSMRGREGDMSDMQPPQLILQLPHTVNDWAVRILLECILVYK